MVILTLTREEAARLQKCLDRYLAELRTEIVHTDNRRFRDDLRREEEFLKEVRDRLETVEKPVEEEVSS